MVVTDAQVKLDLEAVEKRLAERYGIESAARCELIALDKNNELSEDSLVADWHELRAMYLSGLREKFAANPRVIEWVDEENEIAEEIGELLDLDDAALFRALSNVEELYMPPPCEKGCCAAIPTRVAWYTSSMSGNRYLWLSCDEHGGEVEHEFAWAANLRIALKRVSDAGYTVWWTQ